MDYVFNEYPWGENGYALLEVEPRGSKFINRICISFGDFCHGKKSKYLRINLLETMVEKT